MGDRLLTLMSLIHTDRLYGSGISRWHKKTPPNFITSLNIDFHNSSTGTLSSIPPHLKRFAAIPCEILVFKIQELTLVLHNIVHRSVWSVDGPLMIILLLSGQWRNCKHRKKTWWLVTFGAPCRVYMYRLEKRSISIDTFSSSVLDVQQRSVEIIKR